MSTALVSVAFSVPAAVIGYYLGRRTTGYLMRAIERKWKRKP